MEALQPHLRVIWSRQNSDRDARQVYTLDQAKTVTPSVPLF